jgi:hypothetical protein
MVQVIKFDFRKAAPEASAHAPLDERALWQWRETQKANDPFGEQLSRRFAEARRRFNARNPLPRGLGTHEYHGDWYANDNARRPRTQKLFIALLNAIFAA